MKAISLLMSGFLCIMFATSCSFTENITFSADGSGKVQLNVDGSQFAAMAGKEMGTRKTDTTFFYKNILIKKKDSIAKLPQTEQDKLKRLENMSVRVFSDPENTDFKIDVANDFKKTDDIQDLMQALIGLAKINKPAKAKALNVFENNTVVKYFYNDRKFIRSVNMPAVKKVQDTLSSIKSMLETSSYTISYTFPKAIKKVSNKTAVISTDKKSFTVSYPFLDYLDKPKALELEVEFEK